MFLLQSCIQSCNCNVDSLINNADSLQSSGFFSHLKVFANDSALKDWDYVAIFIAIFALVVAIFTLRSQIKTQQNTKYLIKPSLARNVFLEYVFFKILSLDLLLFYIEALNGNNEIGRVRYYVSLLKGMKFETPELSNLYEDTDTFYDIYRMNENIRHLNLLIDHFVYSVENDLINKTQIKSLCGELSGILFNVSFDWSYIMEYSIIKRNKYKQVYYKGNKDQRYRIQSISAKDQIAVYKQINNFIKRRLPEYVTRDNIIEEYNNLGEQYKIDYSFNVTSLFKWDVEEKFLNFNVSNSLKKAQLSTLFFNRMLCVAAIRKYDSKFNYDVRISENKRMRTVNRKKRIRKNCRH